MLIALTVCEMFILTIFDHENVCHLTHFCASSHCFRDINRFKFVTWKRRSRSHISTLTVTPLDTNGKISKCHMKHFCAIFHSFWDINFSKFDFENLGKDHGVQHSQWYQSMVNIKLKKKVSFNAFCASSHHFRDIDFCNVWPWQFRSRSPSTTSAGMQFVDEYQPLESNFTHFTLFLTVLKKIRFEMFDLENLGQGQDVLHSQWQHSMEDIWLPIW